MAIAIFAMAHIQNHKTNWLVSIEEFLAARCCLSSTQGLSRFPSGGKVKTPHTLWRSVARNGTENSVAFGGLCMLARPAYVLKNRAQ